MMEKLAPQSTLTSGDAENSDSTAVCSITAKHWDAVAVWSWDVRVETCAICKATIADRCVECRGIGDSLAAGGHEGTQRNRPTLSMQTAQIYQHPRQREQQEEERGVVPGAAAIPLSWGEGVTGECRVVWGVCNHVFHYHCIHRWVRQRPVCPLCGKDWRISKTTTYDF